MAERIVLPVEKQILDCLRLLVYLIYDSDMADLEIKYKCYKRVVFLKGGQRIFLKRIQNQLGLSLKEFAALAGIHARSMTDWKREKFLISLPGLKKRCQKAGIPLPKDIKIKEPF